MNQEQKAGKSKISFTALSEYVPLTVKMLALTVLVGLLVWVVLDRIQSSQLRAIFKTQLTQKLVQHSIEDRLSFDRYVNMFQESIKLLATQKSFIDYIESNEWTKVGDGSIRYHQKPQVWFPNRSVLRTFIQPRFVLLLDAEGKTREVYCDSNEAPSTSLLQPSRLLLLKSHNQSFMTIIDEVPHLITAESYFNKKGELRATLIFASPINDELLNIALGPLQNERLVALLTVGVHPSVVTSSDTSKLPVGSMLETLQNHYLITGKEFFDYGASELQVNLGSFIALAEVESMTNAVVSKVRRERAIFAVILILTFAIIIYWITRHIHTVNRRMKNFSNTILGAKSEDIQTGDQLQLLKKRFTRLTEEVIEAREIIKEQAEEKGRLIAQYSSDAIITIDSNGVIKQWNPSAESLFGWSSEEAVDRMSAHKIMSTKDGKAIERNFEHGDASGNNILQPRQIATTAYHRDGYEFPVEYSISPAHSGEESGLIAIIHDLTNLRKSEEELKRLKSISDQSVEALKKSEDRFRALYEDNPTMYFTLNAQGLVLSINSYGAEQLGYKVGELIGKSVLNVFYPDEKQAVQAQLAECLKHPGEIANWEFRQVRKDGSMLWVKETVRAVEDGDGKPVVLVVCEDITDRRNTEELLRDNQAKLKSIFKSVPTGIGLVVNRVIKQVNNRFCEMIGYSAEELIEQNAVLLYESKEEFERVGREKYELIRKQGTGSVETRLKCKNGDIINVIMSSTPLDQSDLSAGVTFTVLDITDTKNAEKQILEHRNLLRTILNATPDMLVLKDRELKYKSVNSAFCKFVGKQESEIIGKSDIELFPLEMAEKCGRDDDNVLMTGQQLIRDEEVPGIEDAKWLQVVKTPVCSSEGVPEAILCSVRDITSRKLIEQQIAASLKEKDVLLREIHHRVKNNLQVISSLFSIQKRSITDKETIEVLGNSQNRIKAMALVHETLYQSETLANINIKNYISDLTNRLLSFYESHNITLKLDVADIFLDVNIAIPCGLILNEVITNSLIHAFPGDRSGDIHITASLADEDEVEVIVSDNGVGLPAGLDPDNTESLGFVVVGTLINQLRGNIKIDRDNGTTVHITFRRKK